ncbi:hypothetical protein [Halorussus ruber]|uniref:hypothetical protein n=1 Tax=Halorussus ruber TaxID=1126238 RepID=UPI001091CC90|nr:hypothetical protein [Halorussus ruber]
MRLSKWCYALVGITLVNLGWSLAGTVVRDGFFFDAGTVVSLVYLLGGLFGLLLTPVFFVALYADAGIVRGSSSPWNPDRRLWVGGGVLWSLLAYAVSRNPSIVFVVVPYLFRRFRNPVVDESDGDGRPNSPAFDRR